MSLDQSYITLTAEREGFEPLTYTHVVEDGIDHNFMVLQLLLQAQARHAPLIPDGRRGAGHEERLAEYGYKITSSKTQIGEPAED
jgi:hypothetical protein